ncbi:DUF2157 domain-containing protein [Atopomonas sediminilitoris]|uniref:DUF2157 domain-containing protein n=1 Tax=Atopomonas sediminilitoris TaxID=2919919 RepID=UPI001F4F0A05|nr:DUF2157 domain-containing protein [Atopomonas sediminilitoris]MCJ8169489.1 DUF2157 domain-containing protein [Atopomonas sediminilitoris]
MSEVTREQAQQRAAQIQAFHDELSLLERQQVLNLSEGQRQQLAQHHQQLLQRFAEQLDIDTNLHSQQLSLGMRIASLFGALTLACALFFLFYRFWGVFSTPLQVAVLIGTSVASLALTLGISRVDRSGYYSKLAALLCFTAFVLNLSLLGQMFNITPSDKALLPWGALALLLAYHCRLRLLLVAAIVCGTAFVAARVGAWAGIYWLSLGERPENFFPAAALLLAIPSLLSQQRWHGFAATYRISGLLCLYLPLLVLGYWGDGSYLTWHAAAIEYGYQIAAFVLSALGVAAGIRWQLTEVRNTSLVFLLLYLYTKFFDWWWELLPKYLFFLLLGLVSLLLIVVFSRWRRVSQGGQS